MDLFLVVGNVGRTVHEFIANIFEKSVRRAQYFPFIFTLFMFILMGNLLGMILILHVVSQIVVTFAIAITIFLGVHCYRNCFARLSLSPYLCHRGCQLCWLLLIPIEIIPILLGQ